MKALLGKGLGLQKNGTHIAFTGGTGSLVFIDLIALLLRVNLGLVDPDSIPIFSRGSTFKFILYVSFPNRPDSVALSLFEGLDEVTKAKKLKNFELVVRISSESKQGRWDEAFIEREIGKYDKKQKKSDKLARVYVCGPPPMNELFDKTLSQLIHQGDLAMGQVEIM